MRENNALQIFSTQKYSQTNSSVHQCRFIIIVFISQRVSLFCSGNAVKDSSIIFFFITLEVYMYDHSNKLKCSLPSNLKHMSAPLRYLSVFFFYCPWNTCIFALVLDPLNFKWFVCILWWQKESNVNRRGITAALSLTAVKLYNVLWSWNYIQNYFQACQRAWLVSLTNNLEDHSQGVCHVN